MNQAPEQEPELVVTVSGEEEGEGGGAALDSPAGLPEGVRVFWNPDLGKTARRALRQAASAFAASTAEGREDDAETLPPRPSWEKSFQDLFRPSRAGSPVEVGVTFTDDEGIRVVNREYRRVDRATDVLSFPLVSREEADAGELDNLTADQVLLGDIVVSLSTAQRQAALYGHSRERELSYLLVHGFLHLVGHDHEDEGEKKAMRSLEERILGEVGLSREKEKE